MSDFDTFLHGSQGAKPFDALADEQRALVLWLLRKTEQVLLHEGGGVRDGNFDWTSTWLDKVLAHDVVGQLAECGAVRHGAKCFNCLSLQELDPEFPVIWDGYESRTGKPWERLNERELIAFLTDRVEEGFVFPLNPVWMVRDGTNGWSELFKKMLANDHIRERTGCWFDEETVARIWELSRRVSERSKESGQLLKKKSAEGDGRHIDTGRFI